MSQPFKLPFNFEPSNSIKTMIVQPRQNIKPKKELIFVLNRILKGKIKSIFRAIKQSHTRSADALMRSLLISLKLNKK